MDTVTDAHAIPLEVVLSWFPEIEESCRNDFLQQMAYQHWEQRGRPEGSPEVDWQWALDQEANRMTGIFIRTE